jgi:hypothetical protein
VQALCSHAVLQHLTKDESAKQHVVTELPCFDADPSSHASSNARRRVLLCIRPGLAVVDPATGEPITVPVKQQVWTLAAPVAGQETGAAGEGDVEQGQGPVHGPHMPDSTTGGSWQDVDRQAMDESEG